MSALKLKFLSHSTYSFYFCDADDNGSEILMNPAGDYSWMFTQGRHHEVNPNQFKPRGQGPKP